MGPGEEPFLDFIAAKIALALLAKSMLGLPPSLLLTFDTFLSPQISMGTLDRCCAAFAPGSHSCQVSGELRSGLGPTIKIALPPE